MQKLRLIKPWELSTIRQRVGEGRNLFNNNEPIVATCCAPAGEWMEADSPDSSLLTNPLRKAPYVHNNTGSANYPH